MNSKQRRKARRKQQRERVNVLSVWVHTYDGTWRDLGTFDLGWRLVRQGGPG
jgi:hypothetical protein